ncbi:hypothetical protein LAZ67_2004153 [Cordylochernes scorpioides]|uniref:ATP-dependent DNA helicase n=1 Tax=Cordylochernes scorpioides TaxID=51811 RepID=A0ABY6K3K8_9ARAC|nr:hypothetical protein LAZ67_2004153 [Cordylochernes scorpioides]
MMNEYLESEGIQRTEWPARSPDLNTMGKRIVSRSPLPRTTQELKIALVEEVLGGLSCPWSTNTDRDKCWTHCIGVKISLAPSDTNLQYILKRHQFPLRLAFAMTINKTQGQTFARVGLLLQEEPVFTHRQLYVAFPCVRTLDSIQVKLKPRIYKTRNVVLNEVLSNELL